jgi:hypothetical protein
MLPWTTPIGDVAPINTSTFQMKNTCAMIIHIERAIGIMSWMKFDDT